MSITNPTLNGCTALDTYSNSTPFRNRSVEGVQDGEGDSLQGLSGPPVTRKIEKRNLELRNSVMALADIFCQQEVASGDITRVFQALHAVYRGVSVKEWESIFDGRTPLSLQRKETLRTHITGEAFNRSFSVYPPPQDHPVVRRLNQVKWELFGSAEVGENATTGVADDVNSVHTKDDGVKAEFGGEGSLGGQLGTVDEKAALEETETVDTLVFPPPQPAVTENSGKTKSRVGNTERRKQGNPKNPKREKERSDRKNVMSDIEKYGHDEDFIPSTVNQPGTLDAELWLPTDAPAGSAEKIEVLRKRVELGQHLWHPDDRFDYSGLGALSRLRAG
jgi:hypothetical protein